MSTLSAIENAVCYIEDHLADALSISDLAKQSGYQLSVKFHSVNISAAAE